MAVTTEGTAAAAGTFNWSFDARLQLSGSGVLSGQFYGEVNAVVTTPVTLTNVATGVAEADLNFVISALGIASHADTTVTMDEFAIDAE